MERILAMTQRDLLRFIRSPLLVLMSLLLPTAQLILLGYAFGGHLKHIPVALVDQDGRLPAVRVKELLSAADSGGRTLSVVSYADEGRALEDLRNGKVFGLLTIPPDFSRRLLADRDPYVVLAHDNTDAFVSEVLTHTFSQIMESLRQKATVRIESSSMLRLVETHAYTPYIQYLLPGAIVMAIFLSVTIGGGILYVDDRVRGVHEGYLATPITRFELVAGFSIAGILKAVFAGLVLTIVGSVIAGIVNPLDPLRLIRAALVIILSASALIGLMTVITVRIGDPLLPRALFGTLNTILFFSSGAVYPRESFPEWLKILSIANPFTYCVEALKNILLRETAVGAVSFELLVLLLFSAASIALSAYLFKRTL